MQQGLHNEGFEISMVDGKRTYDLLLELLGSKLVKFQFRCRRSRRVGGASISWRIRAASARCTCKTSI